MWWIIGIFIVIAIIAALVQALADAVGGWKNLIGIIVGIGLIIAIIVIFGWKAIFYVIGVIVGIIVIIYIISMIGDTVSEHDKNKKEIAKINQETQQEMQIHTNEADLMNELSKNCFWLGYMNREMWRKKLPNYANRKYSTSFDTITYNFAKQIEQQHIVQNDDWFEPFKLYVLNHPGGATVTKMLHEVNCPQLKMTHSTPDGDLVNTWLVRGTKKANKDVPALFSATFIKEMNESVFTPTPYLRKLYGVNAEASPESDHATEISFDDL